MGVLIQNTGAGSLISDNHISGSDVGVYQVLSPNCCRIGENTLMDIRYFGIVIQDSDGETRHNTIRGGQISIGVLAGGANTTAVLRGDEITEESLALVQEIECCGFTAIAIIKDE